MNREHFCVDTSDSYATWEIHCAISEPFRNYTKESVTNLSIGRSTIHMMAIETKPKRQSKFLASRNFDS